MVYTHIHISFATLMKHLQHRIKLENFSSDCPLSRCGIGMWPKWRTYQVSLADMQVYESDLVERPFVRAYHSSTARIEARFTRCCSWQDLATGQSPWKAMWMQKQPWGLWCIPNYLILCLPPFTCVYLCLPLFSHACLLMFTHVYSCLPMFTHVYSCMLMFTLVYLCLSLFTCVYICLLAFTYVNHVYSCIFTCLPYVP